MKKKTLKILFAFSILLFNVLMINSYAAELESKPGGTTWTVITASEAYDACTSMKSGTSSIGSGNLNPHMSTAKDYDAISVLAISQYGKCTTSSSGSPYYYSVNGYYSTTQNSSGVMNFGQYTQQNSYTPYWTFTSSFMTAGTNDYRRASLYNNRNSLFVNLIEGGNTRYNGDAGEVSALALRNNSANKCMGIINDTANFPNETGGLGRFQYWGYKDSNTAYYYYPDAYPILVKRELFGFYVGYGSGWRRYGRCVRLHNLQASAMEWLSLEQ